MKNTTSLFILFLAIAISISCTKIEETNIWMIGDSTMAAKNTNRYPESGWGVAMADYVVDKVTVHNHAASGRSTLSFINEGRWKAVADSLKKGDYVIIQFGHNDQKNKPKVYADAYGTFKTYLKKFIDESREKGAIPIVCSSIVRRHFDTDGNLKDTHGDYITAAKEIAEETNTPYIDMEALTRKLVIEMGPEKSKEIYTFTSSKEDSTHLNINGAGIVSGLFVDQTKAKNLPIADLFK